MGEGLSTAEVGYNRIKAKCVLSSKLSITNSKAWEDGMLLMVGNVVPTLYVVVTTKYKYIASAIINTYYCYDYTVICET